MKLTSTTVDVPALVRLIAATEAELIPLKRALRTTWTEPMAGVQQRLCALKHQATLLYILRAYVRGRHHLSGPPRDLSDWMPARYHREQAERCADRFRLHLPGDAP